MNTATTQNSRKKTVLVAALVACLVLAIGGGVLAWFSAMSSVQNTFKNGSETVNPPTTDPDEGGKGDEGQNNTVKNDGNYIEETEWTGDAAIQKDAKVDKNPNIGVAKGSNPCFVFAEVENNLGENAYFVLGPNWVPVPDQAKNYDPTKGVAADIKTGDQLFTSGLFMYVGPGASMGDDGKYVPVLLDASKQDSINGKDLYTGCVFEDIYTNGSFEWSDGNSTINVKSYLAVATGSTKGGTTTYEDMNTDEKRAEAINAAIAWAKDNDTSAVANI